MDTQRADTLSRTRGTYHAVRDVAGEVVCVLDLHAEERGLVLAGFNSRAVRKDDVHELIVTAESHAAQDTTVNAVAYVAFASIDASGVLVVGEQVWLDDSLLGVIAGFDMTHHPNHLNIVLRLPPEVEALSGADMDLRVGARVRFTLPGASVPVRPDSGTS